MYLVPIIIDSQKAAQKIVKLILDCVMWLPSLCDVFIDPLDGHIRQSRLNIVLVTKGLKTPTEGGPK